MRTWGKKCNLPSSSFFSYSHLRSVLQAHGLPSNFAVPQHPLSTFVSYMYKKLLEITLPPVVVNQGLEYWTNRLQKNLRKCASLITKCWRENRWYRAQCNGVFFVLFCSCFVLVWTVLLLLLSNPTYLYYGKIKIWSWKKKLGKKTGAEKSYIQHNLKIIWVYNRDMKQDRNWQ